MFKKILYLSLACFMLVFLWTVNSISEQAKGANRFEVFSYKSSSECKIEKNDNFNFFKKGESYVIEKTEDVDELLKFYDAKLIHQEKEENGTSYYAYSKKLKYSKNISGKKVNLHIFIGQNKTVIGTPFIFGSY